MSAFVVSKKHVSSIVLFAMGRARYHDIYHDGQLAVKWANKLIKRNVESVQYRYGDKEISTLPGVIAELESNEVPSITLSDVVNAPHLTPVEALKAISCLEYQSCELENWDKTEEKEFLEYVRHTAIDSLPGYQDAKWEIG